MVAFQVRGPYSFAVPFPATRGLRGSAQSKSLQGTSKTAGLALSEPEEESWSSRALEVSEKGCGGSVRLDLGFWGCEGARLQALVTLRAPGSADSSEIATLGVRSPVAPQG